MRNVFLFFGALLLLLVNFIAQNFVYILGGVAAIFFLVCIAGIVKRQNDEKSSSDTGVIKCRLCQKQISGFSGVGFPDSDSIELLRKYGRKTGNICRLCAGAKMTKLEKDIKFSAKIGKPFPSPKVALEENNPRAPKKEIVIKLDLTGTYPDLQGSVNHAITRSVSFADALTIDPNIDIEEGTEPPQLKYNHCKTSRDNWRKHPIDAIVFDFMKVSGVTHYNPDGVSRQKILSKLFTDELAELVREPNNKYDKNAVAVTVAMGQVGYVPQYISADVSKLLDANFDYAARLFTPYGGGEGKNYGASLDIRFIPPKPKTIKAKIIGIRGESKTYIADSLNYEEEIFVETEDFYDEKVVVSNVEGEFGKLSKKDARKFLSLLNEGYEHAAHVQQNTSPDIVVRINFWK